MESYIYIYLCACSVMGLPCSMSEQSPGIPPCQDRPGGMRLVVHDNAEGLEFLWQGARSAVCSLSCPQRVASFLAIPSTHTTQSVGRPASHFPEGVPTTFHVPLSPLRSLYSPYPREDRGLSHALLALPGDLPTSSPITSSPAMLVLHMNSHPTRGALLRLVNRPLHHQKGHRQATQRILFVSCSPFRLY